ncbi:hypothetical protein LR48_Vigan08g060700 [Vigna angularis]|uniref:Uncharacterized protein n=1 Tax=Phaseolus angularis TaxID=3914 RepID=A0A0L9V3W6_PHAAN|nr:hypothetical protein LR48_Vigan08g060700 [Vigna angularis]
MVEGEGDGHTKVRTEMVEGEGNALVGTQMEEVDNDMAKEMQHVVGHGGGNSNDVYEDEVHDVEEAEVHDVHDFELEDVEEVEDVDEGEDEDVNDEEDVDEDVYEDEYVDEDVHEDVECEPVSEESLVDVSLQCDIGTYKGIDNPEIFAIVFRGSRNTKHCIVTTEASRFYTQPATITTTVLKAPTRAFARRR